MPCPCEGRQNEVLHTNKKIAVALNRLLCHPCLFFYISGVTVLEYLKMIRSLTPIMSLLAVIIPAAHGGKILVFPNDGSHWVNMKILVEELHSRGHTVTVMRAADSWYISEMSPRYNTVTVDIGGGANENFFKLFVSEVNEARGLFGPN